MWRSLTFVGSVVALATAASSREGAAAYSLPGATEMRAWLLGAGGDGESSEPATLLLMGLALIGAAWAANQMTTNGRRDRKGLNSMGRTGGAST